jgi:hypothetical protein
MPALHAQFQTSKSSFLGHRFGPLLGPGSHKPYAQVHPWNQKISQELRLNHHPVSVD